jgi:hypothetical protein
MIVNSKYRGTREYALVYRELITAASYRGTVTYQEIAAIMGLPLIGSHMAREVGLILGEISEDEVNNDRPMLSAVAVSKDGKSSEGFFGLAESLGRLTERNEVKDKQFWENERQALYKLWQRRFTK